MVLLCVDDDLEDIEVFCDAVKQVDATANCIAAYNGQQAFDILESGLLPDYIFLDINMPVLAGMETLKAVRKNGRYRNIPVIMYSTTSDPSEIKSFKKEGATDFLVKPNHFQDLCHALDSIMKNNKSKSYAGRVFKMISIPFHLLSVIPRGCFIIMPGYAAR